MRFAVIGDIHSNIDALKSVLKDIQAKQVDFIVCTGDLVGYLPFPNEVIECVRAERVLVVQGNHDQAIAHAQRIPLEKLEQMTVEEKCAKASACYTNAVITEENRKYLRELPQSLTFKQGELEVIVVHGSPRSINEYLYEGGSALEEISQESHYDVVICGHTHIPYHQEVSGTHYINAGSVGKPKHGNGQSAYVIVEMTNQTVVCERQEVSYDLVKLEKAILDNSAISNDLIEMLQKGF